MNMLMRSLTLTVAGALVVAASAVPALAQQGGGTGTFKWYVGGHGGVMSFRTPVQDRKFIPAAGGHLLITAKRTGLLLSVDQAFGDDETTVASFQETDSLNNITSGTTTYTFQGIRKYSAILLAYPVRNRTVQPFVGLGVGILHTTTTSAGVWADGEPGSTLGSSGFGTAVGGLEFRVGPMSAFGMWQITTKSGYKQFDRKGQSSEGEITRSDYGEFMRGATHTIVGGLRFSLGGARETYTSSSD